MEIPDTTAASAKPTEENVCISQFQDHIESVFAYIHAIKKLFNILLQNDTFLKILSCKTSHFYLLLDITKLIFIISIHNLIFLHLF